MGVLSYLDYKTITTGPGIDPSTVTLDTLNRLLKKAYPEFSGLTVAGDVMGQYLSGVYRSSLTYSLKIPTTVSIDAMLNQVINELEYFERVYQEEERARLRNYNGYDSYYDTSKGRITYRTIASAEWKLFDQGSSSGGYYDSYMQAGYTMEPKKPVSIFEPVFPADPVMREIEVE